MTQCAERGIAEGMAAGNMRMRNDCGCVGRVDGVLHESHTPVTMSEHLAADAREDQILEGPQGRKAQYVQHGHVGPGERASTCNGASHDMEGDRGRVHGESERTQASVRSQARPAKPNKPRIGGLRPGARILGLAGGGH